MNIIEPRSLLTDEIRKVKASKEMLDTFNQVKKLMDERYSDYTLLDIFYVGYVLANPSVRDDFKQIREKEIKRDNRVSNILWRRN